MDKKLIYFLINLILLFSIYTQADIVLNYLDIAKEITTLPEKDLEAIKNKSIKNTKDLTSKDITMLVFAYPEFSIKKRNILYKKLPQERVKYFKILMYSINSNNKNIIKEKLNFIKSINFKDEDSYMSNDKIFRSALESLSLIPLPLIDDELHILNKRLIEAFGEISFDEEGSGFENIYFTMRKSYLKNLKKDGTIGKSLEDIILALGPPMVENDKIITVNNLTYEFNDKNKEWLQSPSPKYADIDYNITNQIKWERKSREFIELNIKYQYRGRMCGFTTYFLCMENTPNGKKLILFLQIAGAMYNTKELSK